MLVNQKISLKITRGQRNKRPGLEGKTERNRKRKYKREVRVEERP